MKKDITSERLQELLVGKAIEMLGEEYVTPELRDRLCSSADLYVEDYQNKLISVDALMREALYAEIHRLEEYDQSALGTVKQNPLGNRGILTTSSQQTREFKRDNVCPYFLDKFELCALDGRLCPYDSETYLVCKRYKEGMDKKIPGKSGKVPDEPPISELPPSKMDQETT